MSLDAALEALVRDAVRDELVQLRAAIGEVVRQELAGLLSPWVSRTEAAQRLNCHADTIDAMIKRGELQSRRAGRRVLVRIDRPSDGEVAKLAAEARE